MARFKVYGYSQRVFLPDLYSGFRKFFRIGLKGRSKRRPYKKKLFSRTRIRRSAQARDRGWKVI